MALWSGLGQAATVAQLVGADAAGLVSAILQAVRTARRNRKECRLLARRVMMVGDLLQLLQSSETTRRPEVRRALDGLGGALRQAYELVESCQEGSAVYGFIMAGRQAEQFRDVQDEIDSYLLVFPVVSHIDITIRLDRIYNILLPPGSQQVSEEVPGSSTSHLEPDVRNLENTSEVIQLENNQTITEPFEVGQHQRAGHWEGVEELSTGHQRLKWLCWWPQSRECPVFDLLKAATNNFSSENVLGYGGSATVYKGQTCNGLEVAFKRYCEDASGRNYLQYENECRVVTKLQHSNIIKLLGHYIGREQRILVYEYMPNGSLDKFIFGLGSGVSLDWSSRFRIIEGIAQGLLYLHTHTDGHIVHKDLKPSNILLDFDMDAKIGDFGIATMLSPGQHEDRSGVVQGTYGYMAPEYCQQGTLSTKVDVYAFGATLLEIIAAKRSYGCFREREYTILQKYVCHSWLAQDLYFGGRSRDQTPGEGFPPCALCWRKAEAWNLWSTGRSVELIDPSLCNEARTTEITRCIQIALLCVQYDPADRPSMSDVLLMLSSESIIPAPKHSCDPLLHPLGDTRGEMSSGSASSEATWSSSDLTWPRSPAVSKGEKNSADPGVTG